MTSYSHHTLDTLTEWFDIKNKRVALFDEVQPMTISVGLKNALATAEELPIRSEKARSEMIVVPILIELRSLNDKFFTIYSGDSLNVDDAKGLKGECDFILAKDTGSLNINVPIIQIVEAKKNDIEIGIPQCAAQMLGADLFNKKRGETIDKIYGCVTTGDDWQFLKLENNELLIDRRKYYLGNTGELMAVFQIIIDYYKKILG